jgi:hypothetical protein
MHVHNVINVHKLEGQTRANTGFTGYESGVAPGNVIDETGFRRSSMQTGAEEMTAVRKLIMHLLRQQMEALDSPLGLTDERLTECYERQAQVQELRERLQLLADLENETTSKAPAQSSFVDNAAQV